MKKFLTFRFVLLLFVVTLASAMIVPTAFNLKEDSSWPIKSRINLGLDLQGGLYMILGIDFNKVYASEIKSWIAKIENLLKEKGISSQIGKLNKTDLSDPRHSITLSNPKDRESAKQEIKRWAGSWLRLTAQDEKSLEYALSNVLKTQIKEQAVGKSIEVIRNRIDEFGVTEPEILSQGSDRIIVQLPGVRDITRAKDLIGKTAKLEFKLVNDDVKGEQIQSWLTKAETEGKLTFKKGERFGPLSSQTQRISRKRPSPRI